MNTLRNPNKMPPTPSPNARYQVPDRYYTYEPATFEKWGWSTTFGLWRAFVTFEDGRKFYTSIETP